MTLPARRPATYDDLVALPEHLVGELVAGELHVSPRPAIPHAAGASALGATLLTRMQFGDGGPGGWWILQEPSVGSTRWRRNLATTANVLRSSSASCDRASLLTDDARSGRARSWSPASSSLPAATERSSLAPDWRVIPLC